MGDLQAEALPPDVLATLIEEAILKYTDMPQFALSESREARERTALTEVLESIELKAEDD